MRLEGSLTRSRVKFWDSPMICASVAAFSSAALVAAGDDGDGINLLIFAVAAVVVGIEVADVRSFDDSAHGLLRADAGGCDKSEAANSTGFQGAHRGAGDAAQIVG